MLPCSSRKYKIAYSSFFADFFLSCPTAVDLKWAFQGSSMKCKSLFCSPADASVVVWVFFNEHQLEVET